MGTLAGRPAARLRVLVLSVISAVLAALVAAAAIPATRFGGQNPKLAELAVSG
jgi:hypothetical protein